MTLTKLGRGGGVALAVDLLNSWDELEDPADRLSVRWLRRSVWRGLQLVV